MVLSKLAKIPFDKKKILNQFYNKKNKLNIFDVGANLGQSIDFYKKIFPNSRIYSFEPQIDIFKKLKQKEKKYKNIFLYNSAVGTQKKAKIHINKFNNQSGSSIYNFNNLSYSKFYNWHAKEKLKELDNYSYVVPMVKLDNIFIKEKLKKVNILKVDTQGYIYDVLCSFLKKIKKTEIIILEIYLDDTYKFNTDLEFIKTYNLLSNHDFTFYDICHIYKSLKGFSRTCWFEAIFINKNTIKERYGKK